MKILAFDIGRRSSGCAFAETSLGVPLSLNTLHHKNDKDLCMAIQQLVSDREIECIVLGLPLHTSGNEGMQVDHVRSIGDELGKMFPSCTIEYLDERFTTTQAQRSGARDDDAASAVFLLQTYLDRH